MITVEIELTDETAKAAREARLLTPIFLERLLREALARQSRVDTVRNLGAVMGRMGATAESRGLPPRYSRPRIGCFQNRAHALIVLHCQRRDAQPPSLSTGTPIPLHA